MTLNRKPYFPKETRPTEPPEQFVEVLGGRAFVRLIVLRAKEENGTIIGDIVPQHVHAEGHYTMVLKGGVRAWIENEHMGDFSAPHAIFIKPGLLHTFQALVDDTLLICNHVADGKDEPELLT